VTAVRSTLYRTGVGPCVGLYRTRTTRDSVRSYVYRAVYHMVVVGASVPVTGRCRVSMADTGTRPVLGP
jgi:hypothetical protein